MKIIFSETFKKDLLKIEAYSVKFYGSLLTIKLFNYIEDSLSEVEQLPEAFPLVQGYIQVRRKFLKKQNISIIYKFDKTKSQINFIRIFYNKRNVKKFV